MLNSTDIHPTKAGSQPQMAFLSLASEDDDFRAEIRRDPATALGRFGLEIDLDRLPSHIRLPGKSKIRAALAASDSDEGTSMIDPFWKGFVAG